MYAGPMKTFGKLCATYRQWRNWRGQGAELPPLADILIVNIILVFGKLFFAFFGVSSYVLASKDIHDIRIHHHFLTFFWMLAGGPPTVAVGPL